MPTSTCSGRPSSTTSASGATPEEPSFTTYVNNIRIDEALRLFRQDEGRSLSEVAAAVGFTPSNLRQQFKKRYGITPTEYRKNR